MTISQKHIILSIIDVFKLQCLTFMCDIRKNVFLLPHFIINTNEYMNKVDRVYFINLDLGLKVHETAFEKIIFLH